MASSALHLHLPDLGVRVPDAVYVGDGASAGRVHWSRWSQVKGSFYYFFRLGSSLPGFPLAGPAVKEVPEVCRLPRKATTVV